jgi:hypothetical protein
MVSLNIADQLGAGGQEIRTTWNQLSDYLFRELVFVCVKHEL